MKIAGQVFMGMGVAFILIGVALLLLGGGPINFVTVSCGGIIVAMGWITYNSAKEIERIDRQLGWY